MENPSWSTLTIAIQGRDITFIYRVVSYATVNAGCVFFLQPAFFTTPPWSSSLLVLYLCRRKNRGYSYRVVAGVQYKSKNTWGIDVPGTNYASSSITSCVAVFRRVSVLGLISPPPRTRHVVCCCQIFVLLLVGPVRDLF